MKSDILPSPASARNREGLEAFRATLHPSQQNEEFWWNATDDPERILWWNVVAGYWVCRALAPRPARVLARSEVIELAWYWELDKPRGVQGLRADFREDDFLASEARYDPWDPCLIGAGCGFEPGLLLLDGHHRLRKAFLQDLPMRAYDLTAEETTAIQGLYCPSRRIQVSPARSF